MAIWVTEYLVVACNRWYEEARDGRFWLFSDALFGWVNQLAPEERARDDVAYLLNIRILSPVAPLTGQYSRGGLN